MPGFLWRDTDRSVNPPLNPRISLHRDHRLRLIHLDRLRMGHGISQRHFSHARLPEIRLEPRAAGYDAAVRLKCVGRHGRQDGSANFSPIAIGSAAGYLLNGHQESLYRRSARKHEGHAPPEARLYYAAYGGLCFPLATYVFAWTGRPGIPWPIPAVALCFSWFGVYCMYSGVL